MQMAQTQLTIPRTSREFSMAKYQLLIALIVFSLIPLSGIADEHDDVTIRVLQMDEKTPDSVINQIALPVMHDEHAPESGVQAVDEHDNASMEADHGQEIDVRGFETGIEVENIQNGITTQVHGK